MRCSYRFFYLLAIAVLGACPALAQRYPSKPIRFVVNVSVGVVADVATRALSVELAEQMGQPWVVENRQGGNFVIGANACKNSAGDGHTICLVNVDSMSMNPHLFPTLPYDPDKDFKPITNLFFLVTGVTAAATLPANSIGELQRLASAKPGSLNFATLGPGSIQDMLRQWMASAWKTDLVGVPYKGMNLLLNAMVAGESSLSKVSLGSGSPFLKSGRVKLFAVDSVKRLPRMPDVPTFAEAGLQEFMDIVGRTWYGVVGPATVPDPIVQRLNSELARAFQVPKIIELLDREYLAPAIGTPEQFAAFLKSDRERAAQAVKQFNLARH